MTGSEHVFIPSFDDESTRALFKHLFEDLPEAVVIASSRRRVVMVNDAASQLFRYPKAELVGQPASILYRDEADFVEQGRQRFHAGSNTEHTRYHVSYRRRDGSEFTGETIGGPIRIDDSNGTLFMALIRDVSEELAGDKVLERLYEVSSDTELTFEQSRRAILELGCDYFGMPLGVVSRIGGGEYEIIDAVDARGVVQPGEVYETRDTHCFHIVAQRLPYAVDLASDPRVCDHPAYHRFGIRSFIGAPLFVRGEFVGTIAFSSSESTRVFTDHHLKLVSMFGQWLSHEMERDATLRELRDAHARLQRVATLDELTGLGNRRELTDRLKRELERGYRQGRSLGVALIDFDHFKHINDRYGHAAGDAALKLFANRGLQRLRGSDTLGRWGGEEFLVVLPDTSTDNAKQVIERLLDAVRASEFICEGRSIPLSISAGLTLTRCDESIEDIVDRADKALYRAKTNGRDRLECI